MDLAALGCPRFPAARLRRPWIRSGAPAARVVLSRADQAPSSRPISLPKRGLTSAAAAAGGGPWWEEEEAALSAGARLHGTQRPLRHTTHELRFPPQARFIHAECIVCHVPVKSMDAASVTKPPQWYDGQCPLH